MEERGRGKRNMHSEKNKDERDRQLEAMTEEERDEYFREMRRERRLRLSLIHIFSGEVECPGCTADMIPNMEAAVISQSVEVKPDSDGEERLLIADMVLEVDMKLYREEEHEVILDVYTPLRQCIPKGKTEALESLLIRNFSRCV